MSGDAQSGAVNLALPQAITVRIVDRLGAAIAGQSVTFAVTLGSGAVAQTYSDALERSVPANPAIGNTLIGDSHNRFDPGNVPASTPTVSSGRDLEWPQIGIGFGLGIVLVLGLLLAARATRVRPLAH